MKLKTKFLALFLLLTSSLWAQLATIPGAKLGSLTPITSSNGTLNATFPIVTGTGVPAVLVQLDQDGGSFTTGAIRFQVSYDGTNYVSMKAPDVLNPQSNAGYTPVTGNVITPFTLAASTKSSFLLLMHGAQAVQILMSTALTGTGTVTAFYSLMPSLNTDVVNIAGIGGVAIVSALLPVQGGGSVGGGMSTDGVPVTISGSDYVGGSSGTGSKQTIKVDSSGGQALAAETTKVIGTVRAQGNLGGAFDAAKAANAPANGLMIAGSDYGGTPALQFWKVDSSGNGQVAVTNIPHVVADSGSTTAVTQATGTNLHAVLDANASVVIGKAAIDQTTPGTTNAVEITASTDANIGLTSTSKAAVTSSVSVKTTAGNVYGVFFLNGAVAGCWLELINSASAGTLGTAVITNIPMASSGTQLLMFSPPIGGFTSGIAVGSASAIGGASACGTAATGVTLLYK